MTEKDIWDTELDLKSLVKANKSRNIINKKQYSKNVTKLKEKYKVNKEKKGDLKTEIKKLLEQLPESKLLNDSDTILLHDKKYKFTYIIQKNK
jgi:hypothetical protein